MTASTTTHVTPLLQLPTLIRFADLLVAVVGALVALALGAPTIGVLFGAGGWVVQRLVQIGDRRLTARIEDSLRRAGIRQFEAFGRIWLLAGAIVLAAVIGSKVDGGAAAVAVFVLYSVGFMIRLASGPPNATHQPTPRSTN